MRRDAIRVLGELGEDKRAVTALIEIIGGNESIASKVAVAEVLVKLSR